MASDGNSGSEGMPRGLARPALRALAGAGIADLDELARHREQDVAALHGMGPKALQKLKEAMQARGLGFASDERQRRG